MLPLTLALVGEENIIRKIGGTKEVKSHLNNLGFVVGGTVTVINTIGGNLIVNIKESRIAISREMSQKIMIKNSIFPKPLIFQGFSPIKCSILMYFPLFLPL